MLWCNSIQLFFSQTFLFILHIYIYIYIYIYISSSSCHAASTDIPDPLSPLFPIGHHRSSGLHPVSSHSYRMYVLAGRPALARSDVGVHRSTSLMRYISLRLYFYRLLVDWLIDFHCIPSHLPYFILRFQRIAFNVSIFTYFGNFFLVFFFAYGPIR